jgi:hypothetical protein
MIVYRVGKLADGFTANPRRCAVCVGDFVCRDAVGEGDKRFPAIDVFGQGRKHRYAHLLRYIVSGSITPVVRAQARSAVTDYQWTKSGEQGVGGWSVSTDRTPS